MGSATTQALATTTAELTAASVNDLTVARELFAAAREIADSAQLSGALSAWGAPGAARAQVARTVFAGYGPTAVQLLSSAVSQRWSSAEDLVSGIEELAIRAAAIGAPLVHGQPKLEKSKVSIAVGGKAAFYYLPLTISEQLGYFKAEGLDVEISDFSGGARALQAVVGGSADVCSGAFEHTINLQAKNQFFQSFVLQGRAPQIAIGVSTKNMPAYVGIADLKGRKIGVSAPGSSTNMVANLVLSRGGLKASDVSYIGVGVA